MSRQIQVAMSKGKRLKEIHEVLDTALKTHETASLLVARTLVDATQKARKIAKGPDTVVVHLLNSDNPEDPSEWDGQWKLYSFDRRHSVYKGPFTFFPPDIGFRSKLRAGTAFALSYYEHGGCQWSLANEGHSHDLFDSVGLAGVLVWEHSVGDMGAKTYEDRQKDARMFLETYSKWCNGEVYGYSIEDANGEILDSCFGFYDVKGMIDNIRDVVGNREYTVTGEASWIADGEKLNCDSQSPEKGEEGNK